MYKFLFLIIAAIPASYHILYAQETPCTVKISIDTVTHIPKAETAFSIFNKETDNLHCYAFRSASVFSIYFGLEIFSKPICFTPGSKAIIIFTDRSQIIATNDQQPNCQGNFLMNAAIANNNFTEKQDIFNALSSKIIKGIRFYSADGYFDFALTEYGDEASAGNAGNFMKSLNCLKATAL